MSAMASQIIGVSSICSTVCSGADQRKHQSSASLTFVRGMHRSRWIPLTKGLVTWKMFSFDDDITERPNSLVLSTNNEDKDLEESILLYQYI